MTQKESSRTSIVAIILLGSFILAACSGTVRLSALFVNATVDLGAMDLGVPVPLDGAWEFYWNRFVDPSVLLDGEPPVHDAIAPFPSEWMTYGVPGVEPEGYCTWHLRITGLDPARAYGLRSSSFLSAALIFANGTLVQSHGRPGKSALEEVPGWFSLISPVQCAPDGSLDLVIHASNFADRQGGTRSSIFLSTYGVVAAVRERAVAYELFVVGAIAAMGAYYLGVYGFRRKEKAALWFGLLCVVLSLRVLCYDEYYLLSLVPGLPWRFLFDLGYLTFTAAVALFAAFVHATYPEEFPGWAAITAAVTSALYSAVVLLAPTRFSSLGLVWFQCAVLVVALGTAGALIRAAVRKRLGTGLFGLGFLAMCAAMIHDMLVSAGLVRGAFLMQMGMLAFLFALSLILTRRFSGAIAQAETHSGDLARMNRSLERFVPREFLGFLKKDTVEQIALGDSSAEEMAVLFVDVRAFSGLAESSTPEETFSFINEYLARVGPAVRAHGGFIDKYLGDGFMALFPGGAESAVLCALDVQSRVAVYNIDRQCAGRKAIRVGIGVHTGRLMLGTIGEEARMDGTVISDAVNLASRLEGVSKAYDLGIAASERILADLPDPTVFRMRFIGKVKVKGKNEPVSVFDIYEGDPEELRAKKDLVRVAFERGIQAYYERRFGDARTLFAQVVAVLPDDGATLKYLGAIESRAPNDGVIE
jgi:class 3 adenylate cyclase